MSTEQLNKNKNYYETLGVNSNATTEEIKVAYRNLAKQWHPDINKNQEAEEMFKSIAAAYEILSNENLKQQYDNRSEEYPNNYNSVEVRYSKNTYEDDEDKADEIICKLLTIGTVSTISVIPTIYSPFSRDLKMSAAGIEMLVAVSAIVAARWMNSKR